MRSCRLLSVIAVACCGFVCVFTAPLCPCPEGKWQPPFRPSQVLYSEFPEDRGRSLDIDRQDVSRKGYPYAYEPLTNNRLPDDPPPRDYSEDYPTGGKGSEKDYPNKDYGAKDYPDYGDSSSREQPQGSPEYSSEGSREYYQPYSNYGDYKDEKSKEAGDNDADFTVEDFELDPVVMNPPPPLGSNRNNSTQESRRRRPKEEQHDEVHEPTEPPTTQPSSPSRLPTPVPIQATGYPLTRTPVPVFRNPALSLMSPQQTGWGHWKNVLAEAELSNLQVMKPPPLGQAQTWRTMNNFVSPVNNQYGKRPLRYA